MDIQSFPTLTNPKQNKIQTLQCFYVGVYCIKFKEEALGQ